MPLHSDTYSNGITPKGGWKTAGKIYFNNNDKSVVQCDAPGLMCPPGFKTGAVCYAHNMCAEGYSCWYAGTILGPTEVSPLGGECMEDTFCHPCIKNLERVTIMGDGISKIQDNQALQEGGNVGINLGSSSEIAKVTILNGASSLGGGIFVERGKLILRLWRARAYT